MTRMPKLLFAIALIAAHLMIFPAGWAKESNNNEEIDFLYGFLSGPYILVGRLPDSNRTYSGKVLFKQTKEKLAVTRIIEGKTVKASGSVEATGDGIKVLRMRFTEEGRDYEATYLISSDLDNYGRLSGYLYLKKGHTKKPGLEVLFIDHEAMAGN